MRLVCFILTRPLRVRKPISKFRRDASAVLARECARLTVEGATIHFIPKHNWAFRGKVPTKSVSLNGLSG